MLPGSHRGGGGNVGFPDVCLTPAAPSPVPVPYPNTAQNQQATGFSTTVKFSMCNALNLGTRISMTSGDDAGTAHPNFKQAGAYTAGNPTIFVEKQPAIHLLCPTTGNNMNNPLGAALIPSVTTVLLTCAGLPTEPGSVETPPLGLSLAELEQLEQRLRSGSSEAGLGESVAVHHAMLADSIGYLAIGVFNFEVPTMVHSALRQLETESMRALIIDLRDNPGGDVRAALRLAGELLPRGAVVAQRRDPDGDVVPLRAHGEPRSVVPIALLVNGATASAAELFAAALGAHDRAVLVGTRTHGKATAQRLRPGPEGPRSITEAVFLGPDGQRIDGTGLEPDLPAAEEAAASPGPGDTTCRAAEQWLRGQRDPR